MGGVVSFLHEATLRQFQGQCEPQTVINFHAVATLNRRLNAYKSTFAGDFALKRL